MKMSKYGLKFDMVDHVRDFSSYSSARNKFELFHELFSIIECERTDELANLLMDKYTEIEILEERLEDLRRYEDSALKVARSRVSNSKRKDIERAEQDLQWLG